MNKRSFATRPSRRPARAPRAEAAAEGPGAENREKILRAAEALFSTQGFHGTGLREIADKAKVSLGNIYNHFDTKEALFAALMAELEATYLDPKQPLAKALLECEFPGGLEKIGEASKATVEKFASYIRLIYVDVIEFEGTHVARLYGGMHDRYKKVFGPRIEAARKRGELSDEADPVIGAMMTSIVYMFYFTVEHLFGVKKHYGLDDDQVIKEFAKVFRLGILKR